MHPDIFNRRRRGLMQLMGDGIAIIPTNNEMHRNGDVHYRFRPDSDFYYLTQFPEPEAVAVLIPNRDEGEFILFCRKRDPKREQWEGRRAGLEKALEQYGADQAYEIEELETVLPKLLVNRDKVYTCTGRHPDFDQQLFGWINEIKSRVRSGVHAPTEFLDLTYILHELRLFKKTEELRIMRRAAKLSAAGHRHAMQVCRPQMYEYEIQAALEMTFMKGGSYHPAYPSIVASGENACILHYTENQSLCQDGDLLLIDAGAELECYASDVTRTFPVNGKYSAEQRALYDLVLAAQSVAIENIRPGKAWRVYHNAAVEVLAQGMLDLGLLKGTLENVIEKEEYKRFYMHGTGHWLGMDVHDVGEYKVEDAWRVLEPGMALTVEPGIYITPADDVDTRWHNIGIRIEDDVVVGKDEPDILSRDIPVDPDEIEAIMADARA